jgi:hypothetical protein
VLPDVEGEYLPDRETALSVTKSSAQEVLLEAVKFRQVPPDDIQVITHTELLLAFLASIGLVRGTS